MHHGRRPCGDDHVTKSRNRKLIRMTSSNEHLKHTVRVSISVTIIDIWTKFDTELKHHTVNMTDCAKFTWLENPRWRRPPSWISENVNNSKLDRAICTQFGGQMHHGHAEMTHDQNSKPEVVCVTPLNECREHRCDDVKAYKSSQLTDLYFQKLYKLKL